MAEYKYIIIAVGIIIVMLLFYRRESIKSQMKEVINKELKSNGLVSKTFLQTYNDEYAFEYIEDQIRKKEILKVEIDDGEQLYLLLSDFMQKKEKLLEENFIDINVLTKYWKINRMKYYASVMAECEKRSGKSLINISDESDTIFYVNQQGLKLLKDVFFNKTIVRIDDLKKIIGEQPIGIVLNVVKESLRKEYYEWYIYYQKQNKIAWFNRVLIEKVMSVKDDIIDMEIMKNVFCNIAEDDIKIITERVYKIIRDVTGGDDYELLKNEREDVIRIKKQIFEGVLRLAGKEIVTMKDVSQVIKNSKYNHIIMHHMIENYDEMKGFIFFSDYDAWINEKYIYKYKCGKCEKIFLNLKTYGPKSYCEKCLEQIHRKEDEDEKKGKTVKRYVDAPPPGIKIKM